MKKTYLTLLSVLSLTLLWTGCEKEPDPTNNNNNPIQALTMTDSRDNEVYVIDTFGSQIWMTENLRFNATGSWSNPANPDAKYGRLYDWTTLMDGATSSAASPSGVKGICPTGWHVPSEAEINILEIHLGMNPSDTANTATYRGSHGASMKSISGWNNNLNGTNSSNFNGLPAGYATPSGLFGSLGSTLYLWSSTEMQSNVSNVYLRQLYYSNSGVYQGNDPKPYGYSCRCVKN
jgi:uncharacterized protein (TIGR02145 family)